MTEFRSTDYLPAMGKRWLLPLYDPFTRLIGAGRIHRRLIDEAGVVAGQRVLEIGCGTGNLLTLLVRRVPGVEAVGIDPDPAALRRARRKSAARYERAYAGELPLPDDSFDRVLSSLMLHHLPDEERTRALREARRVLRPDGRLQIADIASGHRRVVDADTLTADLAAAGFTDVTHTGNARSRLGAVAFYRASP